MTTTVDLGPAAERMATLIEGVPDEALGWATPCAEYTVGDLLDHVAGAVALDELVIHGWDLAKATGQPVGYDGPGLEMVLDTVQSSRGGGIEGLFGHEVPIRDDAPLVDRILGLTGRDAAWEAHR